MKHCLSKLAKPPIIAQNTLNFSDTVTYPAVTLCYKNSDGQGYNEEILKVNHAFNESFNWMCKVIILVS